MIASAYIRFHLGRLTVTVLPGRCRWGYRISKTHGDVGLRIFVVTYIWHTKRRGRVWGVRVVRRHRVGACG